MNEPLISIIVPVYNVEKYLGKCIESLIDQTYPNIEIVLVDDGSRDDSGRLCDDYQMQYSFIKVVHKENGGLSQTRNVGLKLAKGVFIGFVDSDDWIEPNMYAILISVLIETGADIAVCNYMAEAEDSSFIKKKSKSPDIKLYSSDEVYTNAGKSAYIDMIRFLEGKVNWRLFKYIKN